DGVEGFGEVVALDAELGLVVARRDVRVDVGLDAGIDPERDAGAALLGACPRRDANELLDALGLDGRDALVPGADGHVELVVELGHTAEDDVARRDADAKGQFELATGNDVGAAALPGERADD